MGKYVHFIGIAGTAMAPAAKMMQDMGWKVTGSDKGFYPPISIYLKDNNLVCMPGYKKEHITNPDLIVMGNAISLKNPEYLVAKEKGIPIISYPELLGEYLVKGNSIVVAGAYGKTTTTSLVTWILTSAGYNPSYMIGGIALNFDSGIKNTASEWSVLEGDEYNSVKYDLSPKFMYYRTKYLVLSSATWDHVDLYPTEENYVNAFIDLVKGIPEDGLLVVKENGENLDKIIPYAKCRVVTYSPKMFEVINNKGLAELKYNNKTIKLQIIGKFNVENISAAFTLTKEIGIPEDEIIKALESFKGLRRRIEVRAEVNHIMVIDDFAHTWIKAKASIDSLKEWYPDRRIWAVFEPHSMTARTKKSMEWFKNSFDNADNIIIGDIYRGSALESEIKASPEGIVENIEGKEGHKWAIKDSEQVVDKIVNEAEPNDIILFMSSGSFQGALVNTIDKLKFKYNQV